MVNLLDIVKVALRVSTTFFDDELNMLIGAARAEMTANGIDLSNENFADLISLAVINYCKANFGNNANKEAYDRIYHSLLSYLMTACKLVV